MIEGLMATAGRLEAILMGGASLAAIVILLKILKKTEFKIWNIDFDLKHAWLIFSAFTFAHIYVTYRFVQRCVEIYFTAEVLNHDAWKALTGGKLIWFDGLIARVELAVSPSGHSFYVMDPVDPTTWLAFTGITAVFFAVLRFRNTKWRVRIGTFIAALMMVVANWAAGSNWVVAASELSLKDPAKSTYLIQFQKHNQNESVNNP